eukprot:gene3881-biopygen5311
MPAPRPRHSCQIVKLEKNAVFCTSMQYCVLGDTVNCAGSAGTKCGVRGKCGALFQKCGASAGHFPNPQLHFPKSAGQEWAHFQKCGESAGKQVQRQNYVHLPNLSLSNSPPCGAKRPQRAPRRRPPPPPRTRAARREHRRCSAVAAAAPSVACAASAPPARPAAASAGAGGGGG